MSSPTRTFSSPTIALNRSVTSVIGIMFRKDAQNI
jgi:hypothetical protein